MKAGRERRTKCWKEFSECLVPTNCPFELSRPVEGLIAEIFLPFADMGLVCRYALAKNELEISFRPSSNVLLKAFYGVSGPLDYVRRQSKVEANKGVSDGLNSWQ